jgi:8-oxo-dGTP pyrophosphatase MutT (NUDIX family)
MLKINDAVAAIIVYEDGRILMQLRDDCPDIWYPNHWGLFGGGVEVGEDPEEALRRELYEELELVKQPTRPLAKFDFDLSPIGHGKAFRSYFEVQIDAADMNKICIHEGKEARLFEVREILSEIRITPYDAFALKLFIDRINFRD